MKRKKDARYWMRVFYWVRRMCLELPFVIYSIAVMTTLKLSRHKEGDEIKFELDSLAHLTTSQRFQMMFSKTQEMLNLLKKHEHRKTPRVIKRT